MNEDQLITVARYLEGDMEGEEKTAFEAAFLADETLQELAAQYKDAHESVKMNIAPHAQDQAVAAALASLNQQYFKSQVQPDTNPQSAGSSQPAISTAKEVRKIRIQPYIKWMSIAAILVIGLFVWAPWSSGLYEKYAYSKQMSVAERGADQQAALNKAADHYNKGDYEDARKILVNLYTENPQNPLLGYYFAITLIETGQTYEGRTILMHLAEGGSVFKYDAVFYTALSLLKEDKNQEAIAWLEKIPADNAQYDKAKALISELKN